MAAGVSAALVSGTVINDRYELERSLGRGGMGEVFLARDRTTQQPVAVKLVRSDCGSPAEQEALRVEVVRARSVSHPNVCRVYDLSDGKYGSLLVMEYVPGETLHTYVRKRRTSGGLSVEEFRRIARDVASGVAAIHAQGLVHGDLKPGNVMVTTTPDGSLGRVVVVDFGFAREGTRTGRLESTPDGGTPNYMSPERIRSGCASFEDDLYALGLLLFEMWTCRVPEPGATPRARPVMDQAMFDLPLQLSPEECKQVYRCLSENPTDRPLARHLRFFNNVATTANATSVPRERIDAGPPPGRGASLAAVPDGQSLLVTFASNATNLVGELLPLTRPTLSLGRDSANDIVVAEPTVSGRHAILTWQEGAWVVQDRGTTNGTYVDHSYERQEQVRLDHGGEVQFGEMRCKLVRFSQRQSFHSRARAYLSTRDGLTGLLRREHAAQHLADDLQFAKWIGSSLTLVRYSLGKAGRRSDERPSIVEMLALRRAAQRVVELTDMLLVSLLGATAGRTGPLSFCVGAVGVRVEDARNLVEQIVGQASGALPRELTFQPVRLWTCTNAIPDDALS